MAGSRSVTRVEGRPPAEDADPGARERVGSVLDEKWTLERVLGSGGMGSVYAARHRNGARGAVKVLHPELARREDIRERFLREGYAANRVEHRGAVQVLDDDIVKDGPDAGTAYLVMEMLEGESLEERIERGPPLTEAELLSILDDVLAVLEAAHEHGVVHRDLKPANLFLNEDPAGPSVKVLDFGLARLEEARSVTRAGLALGTPSFMAPEQASGRTTEIDARTDIFAVGATAFMILAGREVHEADGVIELVARMGSIPAPKLREVAPHVSEAVAKIVDRALEFTREARYPSAAAMRADVCAAQKALLLPPDGPATSDPPRESGVPSRDERASATSDALPARRRSRAPLILALLITAGLVVAFVPQARNRAAMPDALAKLLSPHADSAASGDTDGRSLGNAPASLAAGVAAPLSSSTGAPSAVVEVDDASVADITSGAASLDAAVDDAGDAAADDAGDAAADDDDDDDDDANASDVAAVVGARDASVAAAAGGRPPAVKRPVAKPKRVKRGRPHGKRPRRRRR